MTESNWKNATEKASFYAGLALLIVLLPLTGTVVGSAVLWDAIDRGFMGRPTEGVVSTLAKKFNVWTTAFNRQFVKHEADCYVFNAAILHGVIVPALFWLSFLYTSRNGFSLALCFAYHVFRIGPYFMNFAYVYTLCHKEGHLKGRQSMWSDRYNNYYTRSVYNWWIGLYYGVVPASFAVGHSINHHKYNNGPHDVVSTSDKPRDSVQNWVSYLPRWILYSTNVSTIRQFYSEGKPKVAERMIIGTVYFVAWYAGHWLVNPAFAHCYVLFPFFENVLLLACVNWCWHAFLNPEDPEDEFVGSVTIYDGPINVLNEDYHVVHHQYPGAHWDNHPELYKRHFDKGEYTDTVATCFRNTHAFELFFLIILREYTKMAEKFVDHTGKLSMKDKEELIKSRLRTCWWGPRADPAILARLKGKEIGNYEESHGGLKPRLKPEVK